jgi:RND family efflux transporter MFP subunit
MALAVGVAVVLIGGLLLSLGPFHRAKEAAAPAASATVAETPASVPSETAKVGDLTITQEAMELAEIKLAPATAQVVAEKLPVSGTIEPGGDRRVKVTPRVAGKVISVSVVVGDAVRAGQTLALIESTELAQAQAAYRQAATRVAVARTNLERQRKLAQLGAFGQPQVHEARRAAIAAEGEINVAENDVAAAQAEVAEARSRIAALQAAETQAKTKVTVADSRFKRQDALLKEELTSRQDWEQAQADFQSAQADVETARANIAQGQAKLETEQAHLKAAQAKLAEARKRAQIEAQALAREEAVYKGRYGTSKEIVESEADLRQAELEQQAAAQSVRLLEGRPNDGSVVALTTPIGGRVQERDASLGETVDTEHALFTVINLNQVWAQLAVVPKDLPRVRRGQRVELTSEVSPGRVFTGKVSAIGNTADEKTRQVRVRVALANPGGALRPQTFVRGNVITDVRREAVAVPLAALQEHQGKPTVYVAVDGKPTAYEVRHVKLGVSGEGWREIASGLEPGERIAANGTFYLKSEALKSQLSDGCCAPAGGE